MCSCRMTPSSSLTRSSSAWPTARGSKSARVETAGSFTKPSLIASASRYSWMTFRKGSAPPARSTWGVAVNSSPRIGRSSFRTRTPASAR